MSKFFSRLYPNSIMLAGMMFLAMFFFGMFCPEALQKPLFIASTSFAAGLFSVGMVFSGKSLATGNKILNGINMNVLLMVGFALATLAAMLYHIPVDIYSDSVAEAIAGSTVSSVIGIIMAFAKRGEEDSD